MTKLGPYPTAAYLMELANHAGQIMRKNFRLGMTREVKADNTPLTETDTAINNYVLEMLAADYPEVEVLAEEGDRVNDGAEYRVICDPVDGTIPFSRGIPTFAFCIAVLKGNEPQAAVIYDPIVDRMWHATRGEGAFMWSKKLNYGIYQIPMKVSIHGALKRAYIGMVWWTKSPHCLHGVCEKLMGQGALWVNFASIAYFGGLIAAGEYDATIFPGPRSVETPAMALIVEEAGGKATDLRGQPLVYGPKGETPYGHIISNGLIHDSLVEIVADCQPFPIP
jgi:fructose-1,6-bisphosphatase/inositol monophosphatase family enzyme